MNILINASNLKVGGGLQVANSVIGLLYKFPEHNFCVVISDHITLPENIDICTNIIKIIHYNSPINIASVLCGRNPYLDRLVEKFHIERVFTIFGPSYWRPKVKHICGFAYSFYIYKDSPFFKTLSFSETIKDKITSSIKKYCFKQTSDILITENKDITEGLKQVLNVFDVYTVTNYYNQVFDDDSLWDNSIKLPLFEGFTLLTIASNYPHKNLKIINSVTEILYQQYPNFKFRFVLTLDKNESPALSNNPDIFFIGKTQVNQNPSLYKQSDVMFLPTLLECFSASYPEAMRMGIPIATSDLGFAHGLCGDAATYFDPMDPISIADCIYDLSQNKDKRLHLINQGYRQLKTFDSSEERIKKYIDIITK